MGKPKKGKKSRQEDDFGSDDGIVDPLAQAQNEEPEEHTAKLPKKAKGKKAKQQSEEIENGLSSKLEGMSLDIEENSDSDEPRPVSSKQKKKDKKKKQKKESDTEDEDNDDAPMAISHKGRGKAAMSAFAMLDVEDVSDKDEEKEDEEEEEEEKEEKRPKDDNQKGEDVNEEQPKQSQKKKGKKEKAKDEEDIDAILADIEKPSEPTEGKKKKKKKKGDAIPPPPEETSSGFEIVDLEAMTQDQIVMLLGGDDDFEDDRKKKKKEKKKKAKAADVEAKKEEGEVEEAEAKGEEDNENEEEEEGGTVKTAAQKKREKRERQKQQKMLEKQKQVAKKGGKTEEPEQKVPEEEKQEAAVAKASGDEANEEDDDKKKKKKDRRKKKGEKEEEEKKKKPGNKQLKAMQEALQKMKEEEEAMKRAEEEKERKLEEARRAKEEAARLEKERKERLKEKKKEKIERQKKEGTFRTKAQKEAEKRAREMLAARGLELPVKTTGTEGEQKRKRVVYDNRLRRKKMNQQGSQEIASPTTPDAEIQPPVTEEMIVDESTTEEKKEEPEEEEVLESWELVDENLQEENQEKEEDVVKASSEEKEDAMAESEEEESEAESEESSEEEEEEEDSSEESSSSEEESSDEEGTAEERARRKAERRIQRRRELAESKRNREVLRAPVVCVLGHVDTGKTKILDKLRKTNVQDGEAGGITQQIGATNVPREAIQDKTSMCKEFSKKELKLPGLLIIDTPGHESFSNLRNRGSSLCDIAILVVDLMHGLEPQTIESINLLKSRKTPFVIALNKIDRLFGWKPNPHQDVTNTLKKQAPNTKAEFQERVDIVTVQMAEQGLNVALFYENKNPREYVSMCPTSALSGDGMGNLVALICDLTQNFLADRVAYIDDLQATVMEVKALPGLGTTIDVILVNGSLREGQTMVVAGTDGPIVTQIRGLLMPQPMRELRVKGAYIHQKEVKAAQGVKIIAKELDKSLAGLPLYVAKYDDEIPVYKDDLEESLENILKGIKVQQEGVFVQASTLGSLEALLEFLRTSKIPYAGINIGPVHRRDIMRASVMLERDSQYAVILAFDVKVEREAQDMADALGVRIFTADIIYHLFDAFMNYRADLKRRKQEEYKFIAVFPCKLRVLPNCVFNSRDPIVVGVNIEAGFIKEGTPLCVPSKSFIEIGRVSSIEANHKAVEVARKGQEVCVKIENIPGETPKLYGRHFDDSDLLVSKISRQSIDAVKKYFREEMTKGDWQLVMDLKKTFDIL